MTDNENTNHSALDRTPRRGLFADIEDEIREKSVDDPFARFLLNGWRQAAVVVLVFLAVFYIKNAYVKTQDSGIRASADVFVRVQNELKALNSAEEEAAKAPADGEKNIEEKKKSDAERISRLNENLNQAMLALGDTRAPYNELAPLYKAILAADKGKTDDLKSAVSFAEPLDLSKDSSSSGFLRLRKELALLLLTRSQLDNPDSEKDARKTLSSLASEGKYVNVSAALVLAKIASTPEEKSEALAVMKGIVDKAPEQQKLLDAELKRLGEG